MDVHVLDRQSCRVVRVSGQLDMETAPRLESAVYDLLRAGEHRLVIDLEELTFCDSIGLSTLILAHRACTEAGGFARLAGPNPFMLNLLTVLGVRDAVPTYDDVERAIADP